MPNLAWIDWGKGALLPSGAVVPRGTPVVLHASALGRRVPRKFKLYELPSPAISWALRRFGADPYRLVLDIPALDNDERRAPPLVRESQLPVALTSEGPLHRQRWQFTCGPWSSPVIRTPRVSSLSVAATDVSTLGQVALQVNVAVPVDPVLQIEAVLPWAEGDLRLTVAQLLTTEMYGLPWDTAASALYSTPGFPYEAARRRRPIEWAFDVVDGVALPSTPRRLAEDPRDLEAVMSAFSPYLPQKRPDGFEIDFPRRVLALGAGELATLRADVVLGQAERIAVAFVALDAETKELIGASEVVVIYRTQRGELVTFFGEG